MRLRVLAVGLVSALALAAGACGGSDDVTGAGEGSEAAGFVPATAPAFITLNTDFESDGWKNFEALMNKFPDRERALNQMREGLEAGNVTFEEIKAAVGPEIGIAVLAFEGDTGTAFGLTEAKDQSKLDALIQKLDQADTSGSDSVKEVVDGWTIISDNQAAIEAAKRAHDGDSLSESDAFEDAMSDLSGDALARFYVDGATLMRELDAQTRNAISSGAAKINSIAGQVTAEDDGLGFEVVARTEGGPEPTTYTSELVDQVPADVLVFASISGLGDQLKEASSNPDLQQQLGMVQGLLGISVTELADLFQGEAAFYVRQGAPIPEITLAVTVENEQQSLAMLDRLAQRLAQFGGGAAPTETTIGGIRAKQVRLQNFAVYYAAFEGKLVITSATTGISELSGDGDKLADDETFTAAKEAADMPDETAGFFYVNIEDAVPLIDNFAQTAGEPLPNEARSNLEPLRSSLFYSTAEQGVTRVKGFLRIE